MNVYLESYFCGENHSAMTVKFIAIAFVLSCLQFRTVVGACLTFTNISAAMYNRPNLAKVSWTTRKSGCSVSNWMIHYDSVAPVRIFQNRNQSGNLPNILTYIRVQPNFDYHIYVEGMTDTGQVVKSPIVAYSAPKDKPYKSPSRIRTTSITYDSIGLAWDKLDLFSKNGNVQGYTVGFNDVTEGTGLKSTGVTGEDSTTTTLTGLQPNHQYQVSIRCVNDIGPGPFASPLLTVTLPPKPTSTTAITTTTVSTTPKITTSALATTASTTTTTTTTKTAPPTNTVTTTSTVATNIMSLSRIFPSTTKTSFTATSSTSPTNVNPMHSIKRTAAVIKTTVAVTKSPTTSATSVMYVSLFTPKASRKSSVTTVGKPTSSDTASVVRSQTSVKADHKESSLWIIIAIALGAALILVLMLLLCYVCPRFCFPAAVGSKPDEDERAFKRKKTDRRTNFKRPSNRRARPYSGISLESFDDTDNEYDAILDHQHRRASVDSQIPLTTPLGPHLSKQRRNNPKSKQNLQTPPRYVGMTIGTQYNEPVSIGTQCDELTASQNNHHMNRNSLLSPSSITPLSIDPSQVFTVSTATGVQNSGLSNFRKGIDTSYVKQPVKVRSQSRGTSPGLPKPRLISSRRALPLVRCQSRGTSPIHDISPSKSQPRSISVADQYPVNAPGCNSTDNSPPVHKIEYNTIYRNHVNNTDNTIIQNLLPGDKELPLSKSPMPVQYHDHMIQGSQETSVGDELRIKQITGKEQGSEKSVFYDKYTHQHGPLPRAILFEPKPNWSNC